VFGSHGIRKDGKILEGTVSQWKKLLAVELLPGDHVATTGGILPLRLGGQTDISEAATGKMGQGCRSIFQQPLGIPLGKRHGFEPGYIGLGAGIIGGQSCGRIGTHRIHDHIPLEIGDLVLGDKIVKPGLLRFVGIGTGAIAAAGRFIEPKLPLFRQVLDGKGAGYRGLSPSLHETEAFPATIAASQV
jgi:hypothetical protein